MSGARLGRACACLAATAAMILGAADDTPAGRAANGSRPPGRTGHMAAVSGDSLHVAGGDAVGLGPQTRLDAWNPAAHVWTELPSLPRERSLGAMVSIDDRLYLLGGIAGDGPMKEVDVFDVRSKTFETIAAPERLPSRAAAVAVGDEIYVIGGIEADSHADDAVFSRRVRSFNVRTGAWSRRADLLKGRHGHAAAALDGRIYVSGGYVDPDQTVSVEIYDPAADRWADGPALQRPHAFHGMAAVGGRLMVFGTRGDDRTSEILDPNAGKWVNGPALPLNRNRFAWGVIGDRVYVIDGENEHGDTPRAMQVFDRSAGAWSLLDDAAGTPAQRGETTRPLSLQH